jgi:hypothetical protein
MRPINISSSEEVSQAAAFAGAAAGPVRVKAIFIVVPFSHVPSNQLDPGRKVAESFADQATVRNSPCSRRNG